MQNAASEKNTLSKRKGPRPELRAKQPTRRKRVPLARANIAGNSPFDRGCEPKSFSLPLSRTGAALALLDYSRALATEWHISTLQAAKELRIKNSGCSFDLLLSGMTAAPHTVGAAAQDSDFTAKPQSVNVAQVFADTLSAYSGEPIAAMPQCFSDTEDASLEHALATVMQSCQTCGCGTFEDAINTGRQGPSADAIDALGVLDEMGLDTFDFLTFKHTAASPPRVSDTTERDD